MSLWLSPVPTPNAIAIFVRQPQPGTVKTRLARTHTPEGAALLYEAFIRDTCDSIASVSEPIDAAVYLACAPSSQHALFREMADAHRFKLLDQTEGDLGQRMEAVVVATLREHERVLLLGSDTPDLPTERIAAAFKTLQFVDVVIGPATDGGYYCIGLKRLIPELFTEMEWSTPAVCDQTIARLERLQIAYQLLENWEDIDDAPSLARLTARLRTNSAAPKTRKELNRLLI